MTEMRNKSPAVVQKWVDSLPSTGHFEEEPSAEKEISINRHSEPIIKAETEQSTEKEGINEVGEPEGETSVAVSDTDVKNDKTTQAADKHITSTAGSISSKIWEKRSTFLSAFSTQSCEQSDKAVVGSTETLTPKDESEAIGSSFFNGSKINEFYIKLNISKKKYNFIKSRRMEARKLLEKARERVYVEPSMHLSGDVENVREYLENQLEADSSNAIPAVEAASSSSNGVDAQSDITMTRTPLNSVIPVCDNMEMDISLDELSHLSQSNDNLSGDDSFTISTQSIEEGPSPCHLNVSRKIGIGEIGRSTSDNPRLRNKFNLGDIGRSFSEHQDDEGILIGEGRNISAPSSSIAIQNNNKAAGNYFERRAYSVSPTQRNGRRALSREQSLCDSPRQKGALCRDSSLQSDSSHCSSVESLLDARKPDPEAILRHLGFGSAQQEDLLSRIPKR